MSPSMNMSGWFKNFATEFYRIAKPTGSHVDIGGSWITRPI